MELLIVIMIGVGLAMDAFAVSVASGSIYKEIHIRHTIRMAFFFGMFQAIMPLIGYMAGARFKVYVEPVDHWIAFGLLAAIGGKMIYEASKFQEAEQGSKANNPASLMVVFVLSVATSIDALAVGVTLSLVTSHVISAVIIIGVITFVLSWLGCRLGRQIGHFFEKKIEIIAGLILIGIGIKILLQHLVRS